MTERFESEIHGAIRISLELLAFNALLMPMILWWRGFGIVLIAATAGVALVGWLTVRWIVIELRYETSAAGLAILEGPFHHRLEWNSIERISAASHPKTGRPNFVLTRSSGDDLPVRPRNHAGFLAAVRRYAPDIEVTPEAEVLAHENGGTA